VFRSLISRKVNLNIVPMRLRLRPVIFSMNILQVLVFPPPDGRFCLVWYTRKLNLTRTIDHNTSVHVQYRTVNHMLFYIEYYFFLFFSVATDIHTSVRCYRCFLSCLNMHCCGPQVEVPGSGSGTRFYLQLLLMILFFRFPRYVQCSTVPISLIIATPT
jgi:hypothetical protein